jgi:hypothetical protein
MRYSLQPFTDARRDMNIEQSHYVVYFINVSLFCCKISGSYDRLSCKLQVAAGNLQVVTCMFSSMQWSGSRDIGLRRSRDVSDEQ